MKQLLVSMELRQTQNAGWSRKGILGLGEKIIFIKRQFSITPLLFSCRHFEIDLVRSSPETDGNEDKRHSLSQLFSHF